MIGRLVGFAVLVSVLGFGTWSGAQEMRHEHQPPSITVTGTGKIFAVPDVAEISVGVRTDAPTAAKALAENSQLMAKLLERLKEQGVAAKDVQTSQVQVSPQYSQPGGREPAGGAEFIPRLVGYRVDNTVQITARKVDKLGGLLDSLVQAGANQVYGISFRVDEPEKLLDEARKRAVADAKHKAELIAGEAGVVLGSPLRIDVEGEAPSPAPKRYFGREMAMMAAAPTPVAAGEQELRVNVHIIYRIKEAK